jgi:hypothetical protein
MHQSGNFGIQRQGRVHFRAFFGIGDAGGIQQFDAGGGVHRFADHVQTVRDECVFKLQKLVG